MFAGIGQSTQLYKFLNRGANSTAMPSLLDQLISSDCRVENLSVKLPAELDDRDARFLQHGLAYHISRKQRSLRLSSKIIVKNFHKDERELEEKEEKSRKLKQTAQEQEEVLVRGKVGRQAKPAHSYLSGQA